MSNQHHPLSLPHITIALCTFNGAAHLRAQLESYLTQNHINWSLWISDDGSTDTTIDILKCFAKTHENHSVRIIKGPKRGVAANFMTLLCHPDFPKGPVALSDQDDIWKPDKLARALQRIEGPKDLCLYGAQSIHVDNTLHPIGASSTRDSLPSFENALVQNIISGHSAVLSAPALALVREAGIPNGIPYQDWWLYQLITGAGGRVIVDDHATLFYRQHANNVMGAHTGWQASLIRATQVMGPTYLGWLDANTSALQACSHLLSPTSRATLDHFTLQPRTARNLARHSIHRQKRFGTVCLYLAAALRRI